MPVNATSLKAPYLFAKVPPSSSASSLAASGTTMPSRITTKTTDLEAYVASASVPTTVETSMHLSRKSLLTSAVTQASKSIRETPKSTDVTTDTTNPLSQVKSTSFTASAIKHATSFERTVDVFPSGQTLYEQKTVTSTTTTAGESSLPYLAASAVQSLPFATNTTPSVKNVSLSGDLHVTTSGWSKIPIHETTQPHFGLTEPTEVQTRTRTDLPHSSGGMALPSSLKPVETEASLATTGPVTAGKTSFGTGTPTLTSTSSECVV